MLHCQEVFRKGVGGGVADRVYRILFTLFCLASWAKFCFNQRCSLADLVWSLLQVHRCVVSKLGSSPKGTDDTIERCIGKSGQIS